MSQDIKQHWSKREIYLGVLAIVFTIVLCVAAIYYKDDLMSIANMAGYSLIGMLIIAFLAGSILSFTAIPVPYWILVFTLPSVLAPQWGILAPVGVGITSALGTTLGHIPTFLIGYGGSSLSQRVTRKLDIPFYNKAVEWAQKHGAWAAFAMSAMFNPAHLPMTIAIGALRFPPPKFILFSFLGNAVKSLSLAFAGYFGLTSLLHFLGGVRENSMVYFAWFLVSGICLGVGGWQLAVWLGEIRDKNKKYRAARAYALKRNKPLLVVGGAWGNKWARHLLKLPAHGNGDVCIDIDSRAIGNHPCGVIANVTHIPFSDKSFGAVFASHLLEHLPTVDDAQKALAELNRIAEAVFIAYPSRQSIAGWVIPDHHLWVWQKGNETYLQQRGKSGGKSKEEYHS